jgi:flagellar hook assembly protein FlgD
MNKLTTKISALTAIIFLLFFAPAHAADKLSLAVDLNNPFNPSKNQLTRFTYVANDRDRLVQLRIYTLSGALVLQWDEETIVQGNAYTHNWDGRNSNGDIVARGLYLVNLMDVGDASGVTKRVYVVK